MNNPKINIEALRAGGHFGWTEINHLVAAVGISHKKFLALSKRGKAPARIGAGKRWFYTGGELYHWLNDPKAYKCVPCKATQGIRPMNGITAHPAEYGIKKVES